MQTLTREIIDRNLTDRVLYDTQLARLLDGTPQRRHHLVNRAMKADELIRVRRGVYVLNAKLRNQSVHPFALAQAVVPGSYVSFETALAYHGWIPESVRTTASVTPGTKSEALDHPLLGSFSFHPLASQSGCFLELVSREQLQQQTMLIAKPVRALLDLVCLQKVTWQGLGWLTDGLRIDREYLHSITNAEIRTLEMIYTQKRVKQFVGELAKALAKETNP